VNIISGPRKGSKPGFQSVRGWKLHEERHVEREGAKKRRRAIAQSRERKGGREKLTMYRSRTAGRGGNKGTVEGNREWLACDKKEGEASKLFKPKFPPQFFENEIEYIEGGGCGRLLRDCENHGKGGADGIKEGALTKKIRRLGVLAKYSCLDSNSRRFWRGPEREKEGRGVQASSKGGAKKRDKNEEKKSAVVGRGT